MSKVLSVQFSDGTTWEIPAEVIADNRATYYAGKDPDTTYPKEFDYLMSDDSELYEWAVNNMNWEDVAAHAVQVETMRPEPDYEGEWVNAPKEVKESK